MMSMTADVCDLDELENGMLQEHSSHLLVDGKIRSGFSTCIRWFST